MDPLAALSVACGIVQFIDFSSKLVSKGHQLYTSASGALEENLELEVVTNDVSKLIKRLKEREKLTCNTRDQQDLEELASACSILAVQLMTKLQELKVHNHVKDRRWKSFRQALKTVWSKKDLDEMAARISGLRSQLQFHTLISMRESIDLVAIQHDERFDRLDESSQEFIKALADNRSYFSSELKAQTMTIIDLHRQTNLDIAQHVNKSEAVILKAMRSTDAIPRQHSLGNITLFQQTEAEKMSRENSILHSLGFSSLYTRYENVVEAHTKTFDWIFKDPNPNKEPWSNFAEWLVGDESLYWISGKAGSGKSTLMKYVCEDSRTQQLLERWGGTERPVLMATFFFWLSGTPDQSSQIGLLRALLHDILSKRRDLLPIIFPDRWTSADPKLQASGTQTRSWSKKNAEEALRRLFKIESLGKVALFIDGLDEYSGDHAEMVELFQDIASPNIKVCLSSRPYVVFEDAFISRPKLRLQDLTFIDVKLYVDDKLAEDKRMKALCISNPLEAPLLVHEIVTKADGVFLWVTLVVRSLLTGLRNRDRISDLQKRLRLIPTEIESLYRYMLAQIDPLYLEEGSRLFQMMLTYGHINQSFRNSWIISNPEPLSMLGMYFANIHSTTFNMDAPIQQLSKTEVQNMVEEMDFRLKTCCAGLLEMRTATVPRFQREYLAVLEKDFGNRRVDYLHRSTKDFLDLPEIRKLLSGLTQGLNFNPSVDLLKSTISLAKAYRPEPGAEERYQDSEMQPKDDQLSLVGLAFRLAYRAEKETHKPSTTLLDELDRTVSKVWPSHQYYVSKILSERMYESGNATESNHDLLAMAIMCGLPLYVETKIQMDPSTNKRKRGKPYLEYALTSLHCRESTLDKRIVELLLRNGSSPNESFKGSTPWKKALYSVVSHNYGKRHQPLDDNQCLDWINVFKLLLENGADIHVDTIKPMKRGACMVFSVSDVIECCFKERFATEAAQLLALVEKARLHSGSQATPQPQLAMAQSSKQTSTTGSPPPPPPRQQPFSITTRGKEWFRKKFS